MRDRLRVIWIITRELFAAAPVQMVGTIVWNLGSVVSALATPLIIKFAIDAAERRSLSAAITAAAFQGLTFGLGLFLAWSHELLREGLTERARFAFDRKLTELTSRIPSIELHERPDFIDAMQILREQYGVFTGAIGALLGDFRQLLLSAGMVALLWRVDARLSLLPVFGVLSYFAQIRGVRERERVIESTTPLKRAVAHLFELGTTPRTAKEVRVFGLGEELRARSDRLLRQVNRMSLVAALRAEVWTFASWLIFIAAYIGAIALTVARVLRGEITAGDLILVVMLAGATRAWNIGIVGAIEHLMRSFTEAGRYLWLLDYADDAAARAGTTTPPDRLTQGIVLEEVSFRYPGTDVDVLQQATLHLPAGSTVAIVGDNGAGKTTLVKLLCGFYQPTAGRITVDSIDLAAMDPWAWRERTSGAFQDFAQIQTTIRETVGVGDVRWIADTAWVDAALKRADASDFVAKLPLGRETLLGKLWKGGTELSGGEWQKLGVARGMMRTPLLLVLDEPTSMLDAPTEHALYQRYVAASAEGRQRGAITLLVSHRFSTVRMAEQIVVIAQGRIEDVGTHDELMSRGGLYAELYELQARAYR